MMRSVTLLTRGLPALLTIFGLTAAMQIHANASPSQSMQTFVIIFRQTRPLTESELKARDGKMKPWIQQHKESFRLEPRVLSPERLVFGDRSHANAAPMDTPITALLFVESENLQAAGRLAASHPATEFGAVVEVRPWSRPAPAP
jgi:hypothetical protein